ncbi:hypothetical protein DD568_29435, partial [Klebsiella pneumoniae]
FTLNEHELDQLDNIIERKKPIQKGQTLFKAGDEHRPLQLPARAGGPLGATGADQPFYPP